MSIKLKSIGTVTAGLAALCIASSTMAGVVDLENRLGTWSDGLDDVLNLDGSTTNTGNFRTDSRIDGSVVGFSGIDIQYRNGRTKKGITADSTFFGVHDGTSAFYTNAPGGGDDREAFSGGMIIDANIGSRGQLRTGSSFGIYADASETRFGSLPIDEYACNKKGKNCSSGMLILGGDLTGFGWSGSQGILEFLTTHLTGWARDEYAPLASFDSEEHLFLDVGAFTLNEVSSVKSFSATADGYAVVPVPAAVWLFGSGLLGLIGVARRKRTQL